MKDIIVLLCLGKEITQSDIENTLYEICYDEHASCNSNCPVFYLNCNKVPDTANNFSVNRGCDCFKSGAKMREFIINHS